VSHNDGVDVSSGVVTVAWVADQAGLDPRTVQADVRRGRLRTVQLLETGHTRATRVVVPLEEARRYLAARGRP
jgi:hypothetical protein